MEYKEFINKVKEVSKKHCYKLIELPGEPDLLDNKIGGNPYIPIGETYPKDIFGHDMQLLLQISFNTISLEGYPDTGILEIFIDDLLCRTSITKTRYYETVSEKYMMDFSSINIRKPLLTESIKIDCVKTEDYSMHTIEGTEIYFDTLALGDGYEEGIDLYEVFPDDEIFNCILNETGSKLSASIGGYPEYKQNDMRDYLPLWKQALELARINADEEINNAWQKKLKTGYSLGEDFYKKLLFDKRVEDLYLKIESGKIEKDSQYERYSDVVCLFKLREEFSDKINGLFGGVMSVLIPRKSLEEKRFEDVFVSYDFD